tara:strand:- start:86 stop:256 length:171 start_codon:yes stop_codon:yes gene_type:complete
MKTLSQYKKLARAIAKKDTAQGFRFHVARNPFSEAISNLTGQMIAEGFDSRDRDAV